MKANAENTQNGTPVDTHSIELSACIYHSVLGHIGEFDRGIKRARFAVLRLTKVPSVLLEGGFLTERGESKLIANKEWRGKLAQSISVGIDNYKSLADRKLPPLLVRDYHGKPATPASPTDMKLQAAGSAPDVSATAATPPAAAPKATPVDLLRAVIVP